jgi:hypothetical protein
MLIQVVVALQAEHRLQTGQKLKSGVFDTD